ncbi:MULTISPECIES: hypothetical protein [Tsukamurella]|uniref:Uncharacterized protein n=1 Tax=Tsukamurella strandjordii TaxID=147577 RepID=A0AA90SH31_9ACTN|nr:MULTISPECIES: hypothetical protein [Tsukamurella]MDP0398394.1 hypothetical protein [Tsukamurella strandjordii]GIZ97748.1 hypothetical protein TTY48_23600 [Tsukamurella sp. TY48]
MTATASKNRQLTSLRLRSFPESSVFAELREFFTSSPGKLVSMAIVLVTMCLFTGWFTSAGQLSRTDVLQQNLSDYEPRAHAAQVLYSSLSTANESANAAFVAGGLPADEIQSSYRLALATAGKALVTSATSLPPEDTKAHENLDTIAMNLSVYTGLVETARTNNRLDNSVAAAYLATASTLMQETLLPAAESFYREEADNLRDTHSKFASPPWAIYGVLGITLASVLLTHQYLARRTQRTMNRGLLVAATALTVALLWVLIASLTSTTFSLRAEQRGTAAVDSLTQARTLTQQARSMETMALVQRGAGRGTPPEAFAQTLGQAQATLEQMDTEDPEIRAAVDGARGDARRWVTAHQVIAAREATGDYLGATRVAIGTDPDSAAVAYRALDDHLTNAIARARTLYRDNVNTARYAIAYSGPGAFVLCIVAAAGVAAGFYPRVREYR